MRRLALLLLLVASASAAQEVSYSPALMGRVTDAETGHPLVGAVVRVGENEVVTDSFGVYLIRNLLPGSAVVSARVPGSRLQGEWQSVEILPEGISRFDFRLERLKNCEPPETRVEGGVLYGQVVGQSGEGALVGANVFLPEIRRGAAADMNGCYIILGLPEGEYVVRFSYAGFMDQSIKDVHVQPWMAARLDVSLAPGEIPEIICHYSPMAYVFRDVYVARVHTGGGPYSYECGRIGIADLPIDH